jgi:hypothetical protein
MHPIAHHYGVLVQVVIVSFQVRIVFWDTTNDERPIHPIGFLLPCMGVIEVGSFIVREETVPKGLAVWYWTLSEIRDLQ